ncbi:MAG: hypothetical protein M1820_008266 [Bogoriella megaspora]|nr:MAG: hypothetical protein M1820_008266 [Bogoriella megaspora]
MSSSQAFEIRLDGTATTSRPAERGILFISISSKGPSQNKVSDEVALIANSLIAELPSSDAKHDQPGPPSPNAAVTWWTVNHIFNTWEPTLRDAEKRPHTTGERQYSLKVNFTIEFRDFVKLSKTVEDMMTKDLVTVKKVAWVLTDETADVLASETRKKSFQDAAKKALDYATAAGRQGAMVKVVMLQELDVTSTGFRSDGPQRGDGLLPKRIDYGGEKGDDDLHWNLRPQDVYVEAGVRVKFRVE